MDRVRLLLLLALALAPAAAAAGSHNGRYRLPADGSATHESLPRFTRVEGVLVSFALPDMVLVVTGIDGRASLSGSVPIMAVR